MTEHAKAAVEEMLSMCGWIDVCRSPTAEKIIAKHIAAARAEDAARIAELESGLICAIAHILGSYEMEDHHAAAYIANALRVSVMEAGRLLTRARNEMPGLQIIDTAAAAESEGG